jgi:DNA-binding IclR family transcriptional regulator
LGVVQAVASGARDLKEIARLIGTTRSTTHRLASCLVDERYLRVVPQVGYLLGPKLIELGFQAREELPLVTLAGPYLDELSALTGDTIHLAIREGDEVLYLHKNPGRNGPEMRSRVGHRMPLARTGIGKALMLDDTPQEWHGCTKSACQRVGKISSGRSTGAVLGTISAAHDRVCGRRLCVRPGGQRTVDPLRGGTDS